MHIRFDDILSRIGEPPKWWLDGVPRFDPFSPSDLNVYANECLLVHARCQGCGTNFHIGLHNPSSIGAKSFRERLSNHRELGLGDPPNFCCHVGATMCMDEVSVLQFWQMQNLQSWTRISEFERGLWSSEIEADEQHIEAWRRIHLYQYREPGNRPPWVQYPMPTEFPPSLPSSPSIMNPETTTRLDFPGLNAQRRLALMSLAGKISEQEYSVLQTADQRTFRDFENRPNGSREAWAEPLAAQVKAIDEEIITNAIPEYGLLDEAQRETLFCNGLRWRLDPLTRMGRITQEEYRDLFKLLKPGRYQS